MWCNLGTWPDGCINYEYFSTENSNVGHGKQMHLNRDRLFVGRAAFGGFSEDFIYGFSRTGSYRK